MSAWLNNTNISLPLLVNTTVIEQPANLDNLTLRYAEHASAYFQSQIGQENPFFLCTVAIATDTVLVQSLVLVMYTTCQWFIVSYHIDPSASCSFHFVMVFILEYMYRI